MALVIAPPGYGKTEAVRQWFAAHGGPAAWLTLDLLDGSPQLFWPELVAALRVAIPGIDGEPDTLLAEGDPGNPLFLAALVEQLERAASPASIVLDDISHLHDRAVLDGLALLVDRVGHLVRFVLVGRSDPALPVARWRDAGWCTEVRERDLRFSDHEAATLAATFSGLDLRSELVTAVNDRVEGWPVGLHLALLSIASAPDLESQAAAVVESTRLLGDYLVAEVIDRLPADERSVALALSVLEWFDADLCRTLVGADAVPIAHDLYRRRLFLSRDEAEGGAMRFHPLFRDLLEQELRWRDPERRVALHRTAAECWLARGSVRMAYHHQLQTDDPAGVAAAVVPLALELADHGDLIELAELLRSLPHPVRVDGPSDALDFAWACCLAADGLQAWQWCDQAEELLGAVPVDGWLRRRLHVARATAALVRGQLWSAAEHLTEVERLWEDGGPLGPIERRFPLHAARVAIATGALDQAEVWLQRALELGGSEEVTRVGLPALHAWLQLEAGELQRAAALAAEALEHRRQLSAWPSLAQLEASLVAAYCRLAAGDAQGAAELAEAARLGTGHGRWAFVQVRVGLLLAAIRRFTVGPLDALAVLGDLRATCAPCDGRPRVWLDVAEVNALIAAGAYLTARRRLAGLDDGPASQLARARLAVTGGSGDPVAPLLAGRAHWPLPARLEAEVLLAATEAGPNRRQRLAEALRLGHESGWVLPFLGHGEVIDGQLRALALDRLHPRLHAALGPGPAAGTTEVHLVEPLTARERSLLELLPTHLSYAEMAERLYLSVNTVKTNLKSTYRKLQVSSRAEAVEVGISLRLIPPHLTPHR